MSSKRATNRHKDKPVDTANIRAPDAPFGAIENAIPQPEYPQGVRLSSRRRKPGDRIPYEELIKAFKAAAAEHDVEIEPKVPAISNDVALFFDASHVFRTKLANVLPEVADKLGKFILAVPYTTIDAAGHPIQMVPDASAMTPAQAKLAGLILHRLLPPITDMDIDGKPGFSKGNIVDARQVRITVNTVSSGEGDSTDRRLRDGMKRGGHPNAAKQIAPITMNLAEVVDQASAPLASSTALTRNDVPMSRDVPRSSTKKSVI